MTRSWIYADEAVRDALADEVAAIDRQADRLGAGAIAERLEHVRRAARDHGLGPAVTVVHAIDCALARGERGALIHDWLGVLRDAVSYRTYDAQACETFAAVCAVRQVR